MQFINPYGAWAFLGLFAVLALYMLRREYTQTEISSTYLWRKALQDQTASHPFQKLKRSLLFFLQLLLAALFALALMRPVLPGQALSGETVMIFDISASMQAELGGQSRMEQAVLEAGRMVNTMGGGERLTILTAGDTLHQVLSRSQDKQAALSALAGIRAENGGADLSAALSLAAAMGREIDALQVVVFSDDFTPPQGMDMTYVPVGSGQDNCALQSLSASLRDGGLQALAQVSNYGEARDVPVECYADGQIYDVRILTLLEGETQSVSFTLPAGTRHVQIRLSLGDAIKADNVRDYIVSIGEPRRVAISGNDNIFLEKALSLRAGLEIVRTTAQDAPMLEPCDLYVFDGAVPGTLPKQGNFLFLQLGGEVFGIAPEEAKAPSAGLRLAQSALAESFGDHVALNGVALRRFTPLSGGEPLLLCGGETAAAAGESGGSRYMVMGFDLHDTNWVVKYDFPIFVMHVLDYLLPEALPDAQNALCGEQIAFSLLSSASSAKVIMPSGKSVSLAPPFPALPLTDTGEAGVYTLSQTLSNGETRDVRFAVNMPLGESDVRIVNKGLAANVQKAGTVSYGAEWTAFLILLLIAVSMLEWWVSCRAG